MQPNMLFSLFIDNIKNEFINYKFIINELENKHTKKLKSNDNNNLKYNKLLDNIFIFDDKERIKEVDMLLESLDNSILSINNNNKTNKDEILSKECKNKIYWFINTKLSCAIDSFFCIFINNIYFKIQTFKDKLKDFFDDDFYKCLLDYILDFINYILNIKIDNNMSFYNTYISYIDNKNLFNFLLIQDSEIDHFIPITTCFRCLWKNNFFTIRYRKISECNGLCQNRNIKEEILYSPPFIEITENNLNNRYNKNIEELIYHEIYESKSKLCDEPNCINSGKYIVNIKYELLELPEFLSFHISINNYKDLKDNLDIINYYFTDNMKLNYINYNLIGLVLYKTEFHYVCLFKNKNLVLDNNLNSWCYYDDLQGIIETFNINSIAYNNIKSSLPISLLIYSKI